MDVQDADGEPADKLSGEHPHVFRQHQVIRLQRGNDVQQGRFVRRPREALVAQAVEGQAKLGDQRRQQGVIAQDGQDLRVHLAERVPNQDIAQAMVFLGDEHHDAFGPQIREPHPGVCGQSPPHLRFQCRPRHRAVKLRAHEEPGRRAVHELLVAHHIHAVLE